MINIIGLFCLYFAKPNYSSAMDTSSTFSDCARAQQSISKTMVQNFGAILKKNNGLFINKNLFCSLMVQIFNSQAISKEFI